MFQHPSEQFCRIHLVENMKQLKILDLRKVTDEERRQVIG